ncbi:PREDICTED: odorant receptor 49a-like [Vollenhovia emeryi]|uniref:odorant receptor 49a-like n=1 Tax=Vollenhovia emeryi TaxID=411798 RepID=UPI0005F3BF94|nr:PREDICTED: odorant receptor 49a-like [Vollenhovia emeryi]
MTKGIMYAVDIHRQAMKLNKHFMSILEVMMFCLIICGVASLSLNLFQIASSENDVRKLLIPFVFASICIVYMFLANLMGQFVIDHNSHVFITAYNVQWYKTPLCIQKMILFLLQRGTKEFTLNVGGLFDASIETFAMLVKASLSYFTVIYSVR